MNYEEAPMIRCRMCDDQDRAGFVMANTATGAVRGLCEACVIKIVSMVVEEHAPHAGACLFGMQHDVAADADEVFQADDAADTAQAVSRFMDLLR